MSNPINPLAQYFAEHHRGQIARIESGEITLGELQRMHFWSMVNSWNGRPVLVVDSKWPDELNFPE